MEFTMKRKLGVIVFFVSCLFIFFGNLKALDSSNIKFNQQKIDFGKVKQGDMLTHSFKFENTGNSLLIIGQIKTSCGCTAALASKKRLEPGENGSLKITFNTRGYKGNVSKYIYVYSNDPEKPRTMLTITANIEVPPGPEIRIEKTSTDVGLLLKGEDIRSEITLINTGERELEVEFSHRNAQFFHNGKELKKLLKIAPGKQKKAEVNIETSDKYGPVREYILLKTNDPLKPNLSFHIQGYFVTKEQLKKLFEKYKHLIRNT